MNRRQPQPRVRVILTLVLLYCGSSPLAARADSLMEDAVDEVITEVTDEVTQDAVAEAPEDGPPSTRSRPPDSYDSIMDTLRVPGRTMALEWMRIGAPTPFGIGARYFPNRVVSVDTALATAVAFHAVEFGVSLYPALVLPFLRVTPFFFVGFKRYRFGATADNILDKLGLDLSDVPEVAFQTRGLRLRGIEWRAGVHVRTRRANFVELSVGRFHQFGESQGSNARQGIVLEGVRFRTIVLSVGTLLDWSRR